MRELCFFLLALAGLAVLTGCPAPPKSQPKVTAITGVAGVIVETNGMAGVKRTNDVKEAVKPLPAPPEAISRPVTNPVMPPEEWIRWDWWAEQNGFGKPQRLSAGLDQTYEVRHSNGVTSVTIGSRLATWNGLVVGLGFRPRLNDGHPVLHALDVVKTFQALADFGGGGRRAIGRVVIDPGHGGENTGAKSVLGPFYEKEFTLDWARRLQPLLVKKGWQVHLTRTNDLDISLADRIAFADQARADLFISLHFNSVESPGNGSDYAGLETYCLTPVGMPSNLTREFEDEAGKVFPNNAFDIENIQYAYRVHQALLQQTGRRDRGVRRARFMTVLRAQNRPAILLEGGYLTNPQEAALIGSPQYRQLLAEAVARAILE